MKPCVSSSFWICLIFTWKHETCPTPADKARQAGADGSVKLYVNPAML